MKREMFFEILTFQNHSKAQHSWPSPAHFQNLHIIKWRGIRILAYFDEEVYLLVITKDVPEV